MEKKIASGLKTTFLVHLIAGAVFGLVYLLIPDWFGNLVGWPVKDPFVYRLLGAALLGITSTSWFAYKATTWESVKIVVQMEIIWTILGTLVTLGGIFMVGLPVMAWLNAIILAAFAVAFTYFYTKA
jgi:hypothetical protein